MRTWTTIPSASSSASTHSSASLCATAGISFLERKCIQDNYILELGVTKCLVTSSCTATSTTRDAVRTSSSWSPAWWGWCPSSRWCLAQTLPQRSSQAPCHKTVFLKTESRCSCKYTCLSFSHFTIAKCTSDFVVFSLCPKADNGQHLQPCVTFWLTVWDQNWAKFNSRPIFCTSGQISLVLPCVCQKKEKNPENSYNTVPHCSSEVKMSEIPDQRYCLKWGQAHVENISFS